MMTATEASNDVTWDTHEVAFEGLADITAMVYEQLCGLAAAFLCHERPNHTLSISDLIHEAYLRLAKQDGKRWTNRADFCAAAAQAIRRVLVDHGRAKRCEKRGGPEVRRMSVDATLFAAPGQILEADVVDIHEALIKLASLNERQARVVELRFFGNLSVHDIAAVLGVSDRTVELDWRGARAWLRRQLS